MNWVYILAITISSLMLALLVVCIFALAKRYKAKELAKREHDEVYQNPELAKMEYDIAFYDEDELPLSPHYGIEDDEQVTIDEVLTNQRSGRAGEDAAIFNKVDEGMEEIAGHYKPEE